ncbi:CPBP family intramembrane glutamic endopeptidase [Flavobacterium silvaticum]|uniref:CPBP family intramembrane metalloprotease n=1 Tax=Flavobacterium silvaticum TaxID=1852020 RepID=A0A972FUW7_9FLAO|nr:type II CAAX endopeptidase family protein [Flavobacterium silvaticum]NMH28507.1 CPBP family intramembrane metalloprotease [Flavobacterium silvaticum]
MPSKINPAKYQIGLIVTLTLLIAFPLLSMGSGSAKPNMERLVISRLIQWIFLLCLWLYTIFVERQDFLPWKKEKLSFVKILAHAGLLYLAVIFLSLPIRILLDFLKPEKMSPLLTGLKPILLKNWLLIPFISVTAGVIEEFLFRGYLQPRLQALIKNPVITIILTSVVFAVVHIGYGTFQNVVGPFLIGLLFSSYYWKYRNIMPLILCHCLIDIISLTVIVLKK